MSNNECYGISRAVKTSATLKLIILFAGIVIVMTAQWRTGSRLRQENRELQGFREQAEQLRNELEQAAQASAQRESEAQSLRTEAVSLRSELETVHRELKQVKGSARQAQGVANSAGSRTGAGGMGGRSSPRERTVFHMHPAVRTNLTLLPADFRVAYAYKSGGRLDDLELWNSITSDSVSAGPDWLPSQPLPLSFTEGESIAREELRNLVRDESRWEISDIRLHRLHNAGSTKWHYAFCFRPIDRTVFDTDAFTVHVTMGGVPGTTGLKRGD